MSDPQDPQEPQQPAPSAPQTPPTDPAGGPPPQPPQVPPTQPAPGPPQAPQAPQAPQPEMPGGQPVGTQPPPGAQPPPGFPQPPPAGGPVGPSGPGVNLPLVSNGKRFGAFLLEVLLAIVTLGIGWIIWSLIIWGKGQTPAKQLLKMRVVDANTGQLATYGQMALREAVGKFLLRLVTCDISTLVGGIMILSDDQMRQGVWDKIATTVVVDDPYDSLAPPV